MTVRKSSRKPGDDPSKPYPFSPSEARAIQLWASEHKLAFDWVIRATRLKETTFIKGETDASLIAQGRREVGLDIAAALNWKPPKPKGE